MAAAPLAAALWCIPAEALGGLSPIPSRPALGLVTSNHSLLYASKRCTRIFSRHPLPAAAALPPAAEAEAEDGEEAALRLGAGPVSVSIITSKHWLLA
jgi:hypothetical protein